MINLDEIIGNTPYTPYGYTENKKVIDVFVIKQLMKEAIHQALVLASDNAKLITTPDPHPKGWPYLMVNQRPNVDPDDRYFIVDKQSILDIEKLIV